MNSPSVRPPSPSDPAATIQIERQTSAQARYGVQVERYQSDTLPPRVIEEFIRIIPGSGEVFIEEMKTQGEHRRDLEKQAAERTERRMDRGQIFGFGVAALALICGTVTTVYGAGYVAQAVAVFFVLAGVGGPAVARVLAERYRQRREDSEPQKLATRPSTNAEPQ